LSKTARAVFPSGDIETPVNCASQSSLDSHRKSNILFTTRYGAGAGFLSYVPATEEIAQVDCGSCKNQAARIPIASNIRKPVDHNTRDLRS
jgi:hypothetical protein